MKVKTILRWILCAFSLICIPACNSITSTIFLIAAIILAVPINPLDGKLKRPLATIVAVVLFFAAIMFSSPSQSSAPADSSTTTQPEVSSTPEPTPDITATPDPTPTATSEPEPTATPEPTDTTTITDESSSTESTEIQLSVDDIATLYDAALKGNYEHYTIDTSDDMISVSVWGDNIALGTTYAKLGNQTALDSWNTLVDSTVTMNKSLVDLAEAGGRDDLIVLVNILNDQDTTKTLLTVANGVVFYNCVSDN